MTYIQKIYFLNFNVNGFLDLSTLVLNAGVCFLKKNGKCVKMGHQLNHVFWDA